MRFYVFYVRLCGKKNTTIICPTYLYRCVKLILTYRMNCNSLILFIFKLAHHFISYINQEDLLFVHHTLLQNIYPKPFERYYVHYLQGQIKSYTILVSGNLDCP